MNNKEVAAKKLEEANLYIKQLEGNKLSVEALIAFVECKGETHHDNFTFLQERLAEINKQLTELNKIKNKLENEI
jgi:chromosome segregation ATPase